eukprot:8824564-Lingulodinium_polyedra.AAC.1
MPWRRSRDAGSPGGPEGAGQQPGNAQLVPRGGGPPAPRLPGALRHARDQGVGSGGSRRGRLELFVGHGGS